MPRPPGISVRLRLTLSYAGFLLLAGALLLTAVWVFLLRGRPGSVSVPELSDFLRALDPHNFGPRTFLAAALEVLTFLLVFGVAGGWVLAGRVLAPLTRITGAARLAATGSLTHRIELEGRKDEFRELADALDAMLAQLQQNVAASERFAANASHELRTPLAITKTLLEVARDDPNPDRGELHDRLRAVNARAIDLTEALLLLSRASQRSFPQERVDLSLLAEAATETLLPLAEQQGVAIEISGDAGYTSGSPALLLQMTTNLLHNAIVHNVAEHGTVQISTSVGPQSVTLSVLNTGDTLSPHVVPTLIEPFQRGTNRIRSDQPGVGLGLAIVNSIVQAHAGTLTLTPQPAGGLEATVQLPAAPPGPGR